jgi:hypothetical protein
MLRTKCETRPDLTRRRKYSRDSDTVPIPLQLKLALTSCHDFLFAFCSLPEFRFLPTEDVDTASLISTPDEAERSGGSRVRDDCSLLLCISSPGLGSSRAHFDSLSTISSNKGLRQASLSSCMSVATSLRSFIVESARYCIPVVISVLEQRADGSEIDDTLVVVTISLV